MRVDDFGEEFGGEGSGMVWLDCWSGVKKSGNGAGVRFCLCKGELVRCQVW